VVLDRPGRTQRSGSGIHFWCSSCHMRMLRLFDPESKGGWLAKGEGVRRMGGLQSAFWDGDMSCYR
jgi:hypothetical protein